MIPGVPSNLDLEMVSSWTKGRLRHNCKGDGRFLPLLVEELSKCDVAWLKAHTDLVGHTLSCLAQDSSPLTTKEGVEFSKKLQRFQILSGQQRLLNQLLAKAVLQQNAGMLRILLTLGASVDAQNNGWGKPPLLLACEQGSLAFVHLLLDAGADPTLADPSTGDTALHWMARQGDDGALLRCIKDKKGIDTRNRRGETPLFLAVKEEKSSAVQLLIKAGAQLNIPNMRGEVLLSSAAENLDWHSVKLLLLYGADLNHAGQKIASDTLKLLETLLLRAAREQDPVLIELLLELGVDSTSKNSNGYTPLAFVLMQGDAESAALFVPDPYTERLMRRKTVAHYLGLNQFTHLSRQQIELKGGFSPYFLGTLAQQLSSFTCEGMTITEAQKLQIEQVFKRASRKRSEEQLLKELRTQDPVLIEAGWQSHAMLLVVLEDELLICNRGVGVDFPAETIQSFKIQRDAFTSSLLSKIKTLAQDGEKPEALKFFYEELPQLLSPNPTHPRVKEPSDGSYSTIGLSLQKMGNCTLSSGFAALRGLWLYFAKKNSGYRGKLPTHFLLRVTKECKEFSLHAKTEVYQQFVKDELNEPKRHRDSALIESAQQKMQQIRSKRGNS